jgi:hypothetical protein
LNDAYTYVEGHDDEKETWDIVIKEEVIMG